MLQELEKFELDWNPNSRSSNGNKYGFPNKTNLKETIKIARQFGKNWEQLNAEDVAKVSQQMDQIRARIKQEEFYLWANIKPLPNHDIYWFSYGTEDYQAEKQLENGSPQQCKLDGVPNIQQTQDINIDYYIQETSYYQDNSQNQILSFDSWLEKTADIYRHLPEQKKEEEYQRYVRSFQADDDQPYYS